MLRFLSRSLGFILIAAAFAALVVDGTRSIAGGRAMVYPLSEALKWLGGASLVALATGDPEIPGILRPLATGLFALPTFAVAGVLGIALLYAGRPSAPGVGFSGRRS